MMAWRPNVFLIDGMLDNTHPGKVTGWMRFGGLSDLVRFDLDGDFDETLPGKIARFNVESCYDERLARDYMSGFSLNQIGTVGNMIVQFEWLYLEWYSKTNGRVVLELDLDCVEFEDESLPLFRANLGD